MKYGIFVERHYPLLKVIHSHGNKTIISFKSFLPLTLLVITEPLNPIGTYLSEQTIILLCVHITVITNITTNIAITDYTVITAKFSEKYLFLFYRYCRYYSKILRKVIFFSIMILQLLQQNFYKNIFFLLHILATVITGKFWEK